jgi:hypothetical protein
MLLEAPACPEPLGRLHFDPAAQIDSQVIDVLLVNALPALNDRLATLLTLRERHPSPLLNSDPSNRNHNIHALLLGRLPLIAVRSILLVVPVRTNRAVHAAAPVLLRLRRRPNVLDHCAVGDVLVAGLRRFGALGFDSCCVDEGFEDRLLSPG